MRGLLQRKVRVLLTGIAIALGVALMAGTYILTDTINHAFAEIFSNAYKNKAVVVTAKETLGRGAAREKSAIDEATLARVRAVSGVAAASGERLHQGNAADDERQAADERRAPVARRRRAAGALRGVHRRAGTSAGSGRRGGDRPGDRQARATARSARRS